MMRLLITFGFVSAFSIATWLQPRLAAMQANPNGNDSAIKMLMGESGKLFANHFLLKADAYFHSGMYPSVFDIATKKEPEEVMGGAHRGHGDADHDDDDHDHDKEHHESIYGEPHDFIERLGRNFYPTEHTHLDKPGEAREIMPWLKLSAELDPQKITTYVAASYWLRKDPKHADEAEGFLRQGLRANPDSYEILLELGKFYAYNKKDAERAHNVWELAWTKFEKQRTAGKKVDNLDGSEIIGELLRQARDKGDIQGQIHYLELLKTVETDNIPPLQRQIDALKAGGK